MQIKYHLHGKEINLTSDNTTINSSNFKVDKNGNMTCSNANITGGKIAISDTSSSGTGNNISMINANNNQIKSSIGSNGYNYETSNLRSYLFNGPSMINQYMGNSNNYTAIAMQVGDDETTTSLFVRTGDNYSFIRSNYIDTPEVMTEKVKLKGSYTDVLTSANNNNYIGTGSTYSGMITNLRGNTVRLYAHSSGAVYLGYSGSTAVTSDENLKDIYEIDDKYIEFFKNLKPITYIYKNRGHRNHMGFGARQVEEALTKAGLTTEQFAGVLKDTDVTISADESGTEEDVHYDELYSLRYEEFIALNTMMIQKQAEQIEQLQEEIRKLKEEK